MDAHTATVLVVYLFHAKVLSPQSHCLSSFQMAIKFLGETDFKSFELDFSSTKLSPRSSTDGPSAGSLLVPVEQDFTVNLFWRISRPSLLALQGHARHALSLLQSGAEGAFQAVFMTRRDFFQEYNLFFHFPAPKSRQELCRYVDDYTGEIRLIVQRGLPSAVDILI